MYNSKQRNGCVLGKFWSKFCPLLPLDSWDLEILKSEFHFVTKIKQNHLKLILDAQASLAPVRWLVRHIFGLKFFSNPTCVRHSRPRIHGMLQFGERVCRHGGGQGCRHGCRHAGQRGGRHGGRWDGRHRWRWTRWPTWWPTWIWTRWPPWWPTWRWTRWPTSGIF